MDPAAAGNPSDNAVDPRDALMPGFRIASVCLDGSLALEPAGTVRLVMPGWCDVLEAFCAHGAAVAAAGLEGLDVHGAGVLAGLEEYEGTPGIDEGLCSVVVGVPVGGICSSGVSIFCSG